MVAARATVRFFAGLAAVIALAVPVRAQSGLLGPLKPAWLHHAGMLRQYMCSEGFGKLTGTGRDREAVDSMFAHAMTIADNDIADALLACAVASFDHARINVRLGFFKLPMPLTIDSDSLAACARAHLPSKIFLDTPPEGDRDKLQHFFGSAYVQWVTNSSGIATLLGHSVESLEPALIEGGVDDPRDMRANKAGQAFAILISSYYYVAPSVVLEMVR